MVAIPTDPSALLQATSRTLVITWALACLLAAYLMENLWLDGWIRSRFAGLPALAPAPLSTLWFVVFGLGGICCVVLVVCLVLVSLRRGISPRTKILTAIAVIGTCALWGTWFRATSTTSATVPAEQNEKHSVKLNWHASSSPSAGYNVYRSTVSGRDYVKINAALVRGLAYTDEMVESGKTYYYVTRSVDGKGRESTDSAEVRVALPQRGM